MPIALDPETKVRIILDSDITKENPILFLCKALTGRQQRDISEFLEKVSDMDNVAAINETFRILAMCVIGWDGISEPYHPDKLMDVLNTMEAGEIIRKTLFAGPTWIDKKKFASPSEVSTAGSAKPVQE
jgi:hypothetical protein